MAFTNPNNVTFLIDQMQDASLCDIHVSKKKGAAGRARSSSVVRTVDRSTIASRTRKIPKGEETDMANKLKRLEKDMNNKFRILQDKHDKLEARTAVLERKSQGIENQKNELKAANLELMKRIHQTAKADVGGVAEQQQALQEQLGRQQQEIESLRRMQTEPIRQVKHTWIKPVLKSVKAADKENHTHSKPHIAEVQTSVQHAAHHADGPLEARVQALETLNEDVQALHKQVHCYLNYHMSSSAETDNHGRPAGASGAADALHQLKKRVQQTERAIQASTKCTNEALLDQKMALLFLYRHSNISHKANMSEREVDTVFGRLGDLQTDNLWASPL